MHRPASLDVDGPSFGWDQRIWIDCRHVLNDAVLVGGDVCWAFCVLTGCLVLFQGLAAGFVLLRVESLVEEGKIEI